MTKQKFILIQITILLSGVFIIKTKAFASKAPEVLDLNNQSTIIPQEPDYDHNETSITTSEIFIPNVLYISGGVETELGEFPWLANLEYRKSNGDIVSVCAGNIINCRYLLTAAHCVKGEIEVKIGQLVSVRVGDHNTQTPIDCDGSGCLDAYQRLEVEKIIAHTGYGTHSGYRNYHDIALIRTDRNIQYSQSVAPISLPDVASMSPLITGTKLFVAGWGHTGIARSSDEKRKVELPYVENADCHPFKVAPEQLCAGGEFLKDSCSGDSGGGLVRLVNDSWIIEGIVSYGRGCGLEQPAVYTRVSSYISWINDNIVKPECLFW